MVKKLKMDMVERDNVEITLSDVKPDNSKEGFVGTISDVKLLKSKLSNGARMNMALHELLMHMDSRNEWIEVGEILPLETFKIYSRVFYSSAIRKMVELMEKYKILMYVVADVDGRLNITIH